jgi:hypothetical protein
MKWIATGSRVMPAVSPRHTALACIIALVSVSFLMGIFLMLGVKQWIQSDPMYVGAVIVIPLLIVAAVLNARRILKVVP